jgi:hypothetical protein
MESSKYSTPVAAHRQSSRHSKGQTRCIVMLVEVVLRSGSPHRCNRRTLEAPSGLNPAVGGRRHRTSTEPSTA